MASSGSDSDCFQSADEGSDDEIKVKCCSAEYRLLKNGSDTVELSSPTSSNVTASSVSESLPERESAGNSQQFRKRPLRRKNSIEKKYVKHQIEKIISLNKQIFKTEKIKPDVLIHDITNNLSKNFNKGITAIQQTSNSLKDLVLHTLPAPTSETAEGRFSYDDADEESDKEDSDNSSMRNFNLNKLDKVNNLDTNYEEVEVNHIQLSNLSDSEKEEESSQKMKQDLGHDSEESECRDVSEKNNLLAENNKIKSTTAKTFEDNIMDSTEKNEADCSEEQDSNFEIKDSIQGKRKKMEFDDLLGSNNNNLQKKNEEDNIDKLDSLNFSTESTDAKSNFLNVPNPKENFTNSFQKKQEQLQDLENDEKIYKNVEDNSDLGANEGWDDFDFDDEDIDHVAESNKNSLANNSTEEKYKKAIDNKSIVDKELSNKFSFEESTLKMNVEKESNYNWSGWDNLCKKQETKQNTAWNLGNWGVSALLNTATCVTQGISNVIEVGLGAPDPEILAKMEKQSIKDNPDSNEKNYVEPCEPEKNLPLTKEEDNSNLGLNLFPVLNLVAGVTNKIVEHSKVHEIGSKVIAGSLDTLETFGKKTMEVLQEGDPGLKKKRALFLGLDKPILSQVLREAKIKAEMEDKHEEKEMVKMCHFETLFDDFQGLVHLEALEMLSRQCELKLDQMKSSLPSDEIQDLISIIDEVKELCVIEDNEMESSYPEVIDFKTSLRKAVEPLKNEISVDRIIKVHEELDKWLKWGENSVMSSQIILQKGMSALAEMTAATVHQFHKCGELLSVKERRKTVEEADVLLQMTGLLTGEINNLSNKFLKLYSSIADEDESEYCISMFAKIEEEAGNATNYIKDAFKLLIPVLQLGAAM